MVAEDYKTAQRYRLLKDNGFEMPIPTENMIKIFVAGHKGMVGSAICRQLENDHDVVVLTAQRDESFSLGATLRIFESRAPNSYAAAAKVGLASCQ